MYSKSLKAVQLKIHLVQTREGVWSENAWSLRFEVRIKIDEFPTEGKDLPIVRQDWTARRVRRRVDATRSRSIENLAKEAYLYRTSLKEGFLLFYLQRRRLARLE